MFFKALNKVNKALSSFLSVLCVFSSLFALMHDEYILHALNNIKVARFL